MCGEKYRKLCTVLSYRGIVDLLYMLYFKMSCVYCEFSLCIVVVVCIVVILCVIVVLCVYCCFYFRCRTAG